MLYLKKYFTEGLIQLAILLSLCGVRVDVGLEPFLPPSWYDAIMGPTSALTQTQFHNLRNRLDEGSDLHLKNVDLDKFFTTRRLLGWVRSLDRLQIPQAPVETWLVQREPDPLPLGRPEQLPLLERDRGVPLLEPAPEVGSDQEEVEDEDNEEEHLQLLHDAGKAEERGDEEQEKEAEGEEEGGQLTAGLRWSSRRTRGRNESPLDETDQVSFSLQECLRLLETNFHFTDEQQSQGDDSSSSSRVRDLEDEPSDGRSVLSPLVPADTLDLEIQWQDLFDIMEPENTDVDMTSLDQAPPPRRPGTTGAAPEALSPTERHLTEDHGFLWSPGLPHPSPLLPLTPSADLDVYGSTFGSGNVQKNRNLNTFQRPPDHMDLLDEKSMSPGDLHTDDLGMEPLGGFLVGDEDSGEEYDLSGQLGDFLDDARILEEMSSLGLTLEEGFSPEMATRLEEEGFLTRETNNPDTEPPVCGEDQNQVETQGEDAGDEADSDSGLSLDFSYSPASPCPSHRSCSSSSSSSSSLDSSSSFTSEDGSPISRDVDGETEEGLVCSDMELEVTIKQEEVEEEVMGAVGGDYPEDVMKLFPVDLGDHMMLNGFPWLEHVDHDHTYNQPRTSTFSPLHQDEPSKQSRSSPRPLNHRHHRFSSSRTISESKLWSRDERRARGLKLPFSNELIVHLPVEEFNDLLTSYHLTDEQLSLVRDIRRRGKNKIAAQNCRKRKMDVLMALDDEVSTLRRRRSLLMREKQESLRNLREMKRRLKVLYQDVFSQLRDEEGRQLDSSEFFLNVASDGSVVLDSLQTQAWRSGRGGRSSKKQRNKKK